MKKYRSLKNLALLTLFLFLFQTLLPPILLSQIGPSPAQSSLTAFLVEDLFDDKVLDRQQALIFELIQHIANSFAPREGLRTAAEDLQKHLKKDQFWFSLDIQDTEMADLLQEANDGRRYLLEESAPLEARIHNEQRSIEKQLMADHEEMARTGLVPDGFMERTKGLSFLYELQDELWDVKIAMLFKISGLSHNISYNYIAEHPEQYAYVQDQINRSTIRLEHILRFSAGHLQQIGILNAHLQASKDQYNKQTVSALSEERSNTNALMDVIGKRSTSLNQQALVPNAYRHAEMLNLVNDSLQERVNRIDKKLGSFGALEAFPNPLFVPPGIGASDQSREFADTYRNIARQLITNTKQKVDLLLVLREALNDVRRATAQDHLYFQSFLNEIDDVAPGKKQAITPRSNALLAEFEQTVNSIEDNLAQIFDIAKDLDFERPDVIIGSRVASSRAFRLNREIERFYFAGIDITEISTVHDIQHYSLLAELDTKYFEQLKSYELLEESSQVRDEAIKRFEEKMAALQPVIDEDVKLAENFKKLGRDILSRAETFLTAKTENLSDILDQHAFAAGQPYYDFLSGVNEQMKVRSQVVKYMFSYAEDIRPLHDDLALCIDCGAETTTWLELKEVGGGYADILKKIDDFVDIESYFALEKIQSKNVYTETRDLFELSKRLGNEPYLRLKTNSIDVVFTAGSQMVVVKGIGDPQSMDLAHSFFISDHLVQSPHVGSWGWSAIKSFGDDWVKPIGNAAYGAASDTINAAADYGGKIVNITVEVAQNKFESAKDAVETVGHYASRAYEAAAPHVGNFLQEQWDEFTYGVGVVGDLGVNMYRQVILEDDLIGSVLNVGSYVLSGAGCGLAIAGTIKTAGAAAIFAAKACKSFALKVGSDFVKASTNTMAMDKYGLISKDFARKFNLGVEVATFVGSMSLNYLDAAGTEAWGKMGRLRQGMTLLGMNPGDFANIENWSDLSWAKRVDSIEAYWQALEYANTFANSVLGPTYEKLQDLSGDASFTEYMMQSRPFLSPTLVPYLLVYDALSRLSPALGMEVSASGYGPGVNLPGAGVGVGEVATPGYSLLPDAGDASQPVSDGAGDHRSDRESPYKGWESPYKGWESPYKGWKSPYKK